MATRELLHTADLGAPAEIVPKKRRPCFDAGIEGRPGGPGLVIRPGGAN